MFSCDYFSCSLQIKYLPLLVLLHVCTFYVLERRSMKWTRWTGVSITRLGVISRWNVGHCLKLWNRETRDKKCPFKEGYLITLGGTGDLHHRCAANQSAWSALIMAIWIKISENVSSTCFYSEQHILPSTQWLFVSGKCFLCQEDNYCRTHIF